MKNYKTNNNIKNEIYSQYIKAYYRHIRFILKIKNTSKKMN